MTARPCIGVTGPDAGGRIAWFFLALAVWRAGGRPRRITPRRPAKVQELDGLILGGGADLDPALYGGETTTLREEVQRRPVGSRHPWGARLLLSLIYFLRRNFSLSGPAVCDAARDAMELSLVRACLEKGKPVLGICRGAQMLNAALGGSLHQEIRELYTESPYIRSVFPRKRIQIVADSLLASILPRPVYWVNSLHHQAVHQVAPGLKVVAREDNELVQAIEFPGHPFVLGVQWHPEFLPQASTQQAIFRKLIQVAGFKPL